MFRKLATTALFIVGSMGLPALVVAQGDAPAEAPADLARGEQLFQFCAQCHAPDGGGNAIHLAPGIAGMSRWYIEAQLEKFKTGIRGPHPDDLGGLRMYPMSLWLREASDLKAVSAYVASLPRVAHLPENNGSGNASRGANFYVICSACHMPDASGNQQMGAPALTGMSDWYLYSAIQKYKTGARGSLAGDTLGPAMIGMVATLPDDDAIRDVIAHIQALGK